MFRSLVTNFRRSTTKPTPEQLRAFMWWLRKNTDTFDPVIVRMVIEHGEKLMPEDMAEDLIEQYLHQPDGIGL